MKKKILLYICTISVLLNIFAVGIFATGQQETVVAIINKQVRLIWNGMLFEPTDKDTRERLYPLTYEGRTYIPVRAVAEQSGMSVDWDDQTRSVMFGANFNADTGKHYPDSTYHEEEKEDCFINPYCK